MTFADWNHMLASWDYYRLVINKWPGWERDPTTNEPYFISFSTKVKEGTKSSRDLAVEFDDLAVGLFYYRDYTADTLPFVHTNDVYSSLFAFEKKVDWERFCELLKTRGQ